jgi:hypothetical protein
MNTETRQRIFNGSQEPQAPCHCMRWPLDDCKGAARGCQRFLVRPMMRPLVVYGFQQFGHRRESPGTGGS